MKRFVIFILLALSGPVAVSADGVLRSARQVSEFLECGHGQTNFTLSVHLINEPSEAELIVQDETGRTMIFNRRPPVPVLRGDLLEVSGYCSVSPNGESWSQALSITQTGSAPPPEPSDIALSELNKPENAFLSVRISGNVFSVTADEFDDNYVILMLCDGEATVPVAVTRSAFEKYGVRPDATIRLSGRYWRSLSGTRKYTGPGVVHYASTPIEILSPPPADPFSAPTLERRFYRSPDEIARMGPRTVCGRVIAVWGNDRLMVKADGNRIVNITMLKDFPSPRVGDTGVFVGYPYTDLLRINLMRARFQSRTLPDLPAEADGPTEVSADGLIASNMLTSNGIWVVSYHGKLLRLSGTVRSLPMDTSPEQRLYITSGAHQVPIDVSSCRDVTRELSVGCEIEVTGICLLETEDWRSDNLFPHIRGFAVIARSPDDIRVTKTPPWWTPGRMLTLIGVILIGLAGSLVWVFALHRLAERRGQALYRSRQAESQERQTREIAELRMQDRTRLAVELHDTISQNLTGATLQIGTAAQFIGTNSTQALRHIDIATRTLDSCREELRNCIWDLRSNTLDEKDLNEAIRKTVQRLVGETRLQIRFNIPREKLSDNTVHALMQIVRELATNAVRHGGASLVRIAGALEGNALFCSVTDNGCGFDPENRPGLADGHFGLQGIEERIDELNGELKIDSRRGQGTRISFRIRAE